MTIQQAEIGKNIEEVQSNAMELHQRFLIFIDRFNRIGEEDVHYLISASSGTTLRAGTTNQYITN